jgi:uncharacterized protein YkwD
MFTPVPAEWRKIMSGRRVGLLLAASMGTLLTFSAVVSAGAPAQGTSFGGAGLVHVQGLRSVADAAFYRHVLPSSRVNTGWSGSVSGCRPGAMSLGARRATLDLVNTYRRIAGLRAVSFGGALNGSAQRAALMMEAAGALSHTPGRSWPCWTRGGASAAGRSNLALMTNPKWSVPTYLTDPGAGNRAVGHRRWILDPRQTTMGVGQTRRANALYVLDTGSWSWQAGAAPLQAWPTAGYFPMALEPGGRWSLSSARPAYDLSRTRVTVTGPAGTRLDLTTYRERGVLSWDLGGRISRRAAREATYTVSVTGIRRNGVVLGPLTYRVTLLPLHPLRTTATPTVGGEPAVRAAAGAVLRAGHGTWTPGTEVGRYAYQWLRGGVPVLGATAASYAVRAEDAGRLMSVRVQALPRTASYRSGSASSTDATSQVR